jgi:hypothetical protein
MSTNVPDQALDDQRIFQALCAELDRLTKLGPRWVDEATLAHTRALRDRYADRVRASMESQFDVI